MSIVYRFNNSNTNVFFVVVAKMKCWLGPGKIVMYHKNGLQNGRKKLQLGGWDTFRTTNKTKNHEQPAEPENICRIKLPSNREKIDRVNL